MILSNPEECRLAAGHAELGFSIAADIITDEAVVRLEVPFTELVPGEDPVEVGDPDFDLVPFADSWVMHRDHAGGGVTQLTAGVELAGAAPGAGGQENCVAIFSRLQWSGDFTLEFDVTKLDDEVPATGQAELFLLLLFNLTGLAPNPPNLASWPATTKAGSHTYRDGCKGGRISLYFQTTGAPGEDVLPSAAVFNAGAADVPGTPTTVFQQRQDVTYHYKLTKSADTIVLSQTGGPAARSATYQAAGFASSAAAGNLGFQVTAGRQVRLENVSLLPKEAPPVEGYALDWDIASYRIVPTSDGGDLWPVTWAQNGNAYTVFGDGPNGAGSVSLGLARFLGTTLNGISLDYIVGGPSPSVAPRFPPVDGLVVQDGGLHAKSTSIIALGTSLYLWLARGGTNPAGWTDCRVGKINLNNIAAGITVPTWAIGQGQPWVAINPAFLQCGQNFGTAFDAYVYAFPQHFAPVENPPGDSPSHNPARFYLIRCLRSADWQVQANWQWWTGGTDAAPTWGAYASRQPRISMSGQIDWRPSAFYIQAPIDLCLFRIGRTGDPAFGGGSMSRFATFSAQRPWHAWTIIDDQQYLAPGLDPDLAQVCPMPNTLAIDAEGNATWIDTAWGGDNTDTCILVPSTLLAGEGGEDPGGGGGGGDPGPIGKVGTGSIQADPLFVSLTDLHLQAGSPAINKAHPTFIVPVDFDGVTRPQGISPDMGAYEKTSTTTPPPPPDEWKNSAGVVWVDAAGTKWTS